jgi:hypothetical protein
MEQFIALPISPDNIPSFASDLNIDLEIIDFYIDRNPSTYNNEEQDNEEQHNEEQHNEEQHNEEQNIYDYINNINDYTSLIDFNSYIPLTIIEDNYNYAENNIKLSILKLDLSKELHDYDCPICYETISKDSDMYTELDCCKHNFCKSCILQQIQTNKYCCAMCRYTINSIYTK